MSIDVLDAEREDSLERFILSRIGDIADVTWFVTAGAFLRLVGKTIIVRIGPRDPRGIIEFHISREDQIFYRGALQIFANVKESGAARALQPLVIRACREVDPERLHVDWNTTGRLYDIGVNVCAMSVSQIADRFGVLHVAVHIRDQRDRNQLRLTV